MEEIRQCLNFLKADSCFENDEKLVEVLRRFCHDNSNRFSFEDIDLCLREELINALLEELNSPDKRSTQFVIKSLSALRILSRDKDGLGILTSERSCVTLLVLSGLYKDGCNDEHNNTTESTVRGEKNNDSPIASCCTGTFKGAVGVMDLASILERFSIIEEALKCLCNLVFQNSATRESCSKHSCTLAVLTRQNNWFACEQLPNVVKLFDVRLLFLLTAFDIRERSAVISSGGLAVLTHALNTCVPGNVERTKSEEMGGKRDGCGQEDKEGLAAMTVAERTVIEARPKIFNMTEEQVPLAAEILKTIFNVTLDESTPPSETDQHYQILVLITRSILVHVMPTLACMTQSEQLFNNTLNVLSNMPQHCLPYLMWTVPEPVAEKLTQDYESLRNNGDFSPVYDNNNMCAVRVVLEQLYRKVKQVPARESLMPILSALFRLAQGNRIIRKYLRHEILPSLQHVGHERPEEGSRLCNHLIQLMTAPVAEIKDLVANFLFVLCKENVDRLVKYTGYGNAAGLLASRGLMSGGRAPDGQYSSDDDNSDTEEYTSVKNQIDPVIGAIPSTDGGANPLASMTEEEKEEEAAKLASLIRQLSVKGIIKPLQVGADGKLQEFMPPTDKDPENGHSTN